MAANDEDTRGLNEVDSDSNHEVSDNSDNKINPDYASMAARLLFALSLNQYYIIIAHCDIGTTLRCTSFSVLC